MDTPQQTKRYKVFAWKDQPQGGLDDFVFSETSLEMVNNRISQEDYTHYQVLDMTTGYHLNIAPVTQLDQSA